MNRNSIKLLISLSLCFTISELEALLVPSEYVCLNQTGDSILYNGSNKKQGSSIAIHYSSFRINTEDTKLHLLPKKDNTFAKAILEKDRFTSITIPAGALNHNGIFQSHLIIRYNNNGKLEAILDPSKK